MGRGKGRGKETSEIDDHIGGRLRERRILLGLTQTQVAEMVGITYQQAYKYEAGINRVSAGRLLQLAEALNVPVSYFYEGVAPDERAASPRERLCLEVARNFSAIRSEKHQEALAQLARVLAAA